MHFLTDNNKKIIFGWSAKCGCTHVKYLFRYLTNGSTNEHWVHTEDTYGKLPDNHNEYKIILVIRNPFERIVSGYNNKYSENGQFYKRWNSDANGQLTFNNFTKVIAEKGTSGNIEHHHFTPQLSEKWNNAIKPYKVYDLKDIDYQCIEELYDKKIPDIVKGRRIDNINGNINKCSYNNKPCPLDKVHDHVYQVYAGTNPSIDKFYNKDIYERVKTFYAKDLDYFAAHGFHYDINF